MASMKWQVWRHLVEMFAHYVQHKSFLLGRWKVRQWPASQTWLITQIRMLLTWIKNSVHFARTRFYTWTRYTTCSVVWGCRKSCVLDCRFCKHRPMCTRLTASMAWRYGVRLKCWITAYYPRSSHTNDLKTWDSCSYPTICLVFQAQWYC